MGNYGSVPARGHSSVCSSFGGDEYIVCEWAVHIYTHSQAEQKQREFSNLEWAGKKEGSRREIVEEGESTQ